MLCNYIEGTGPLAAGPFNNWAQNLPDSQPQRIYQPETLDQLANIVREAETNNIAVRAVGSGWSFTDIMDMAGYMVNTDNLNALLSETITGASYAASDPVFAALTPLARQRKLVHVQAGIKIHNLHDWLETSFPAAQGGVKFNDPAHGGGQLDDGPNGTPQAHGWALRTLGGSGGQSIAGAASTSTHGGDMIYPPLPDMVQAIHLVGAGGTEFFIQRGGVRAIVDTHLLGPLRPCLSGPGQIISDDDAFNAAVVAMGRMGIIYSLVLEVVPQYFLSETVVQSTWNNVSAPVAPAAKPLSKETLGVIDAMRGSNRFLQVLVLPYANSDGDHSCFVTMRNTVQPTGPGNAAGKSLFNFVCDQNPPTVALLVSGIILGLQAAAAAAAAAAEAAAAAADSLLAFIPVIGPVAVAVVTIAAGAAVVVDTAAVTALIALLTPLLDPFATIGQTLAVAMNIAASLGQMDLAGKLTNAVLSSAMSPGQHTDISYKIMDTYDYDSKCFKALSLEVAFNADDTAYQDYVNALFGLIDGYSSQNILVGAYISLRFCGGSDALLAIEQWPNTVCIEMSALAGLAHETEVLTAFENETANHPGADGRLPTVHWGQLNSRTRADIEAAYPETIDRWRAALVRVSANGKPNTFDNDFCINHGLEALDARIKRDISYLVPLLGS